MGTEYINIHTLLTINFLVGVNVLITREEEVECEMHIFHTNRPVVCY